MKFEIIHHDKNTRARTTKMHLAHGPVLTPAFIPVGTNATVKAMRVEDLEELGIELILSNAYHLYLRPGIEVIKHLGGLHNFMNWPYNILTDSGGFQVFSLAPFRKIEEHGIYFRSHIDGSYHRLTAEDVVDIQKILGSDILMALDICTPVEITKAEARAAVKKTTAWAKRSKKRWQENNGISGDQLFGIVQGNFYKDLRKQSVMELLELDLPGYAIGGLSVGESFDKFSEYLSYTSRFMNRNKPLYLMGVGTPEYILHAVENGVDIFDCAFPTRTARNTQAFTACGTVCLRNAVNSLDKNPIDPDCRCNVCKSYSRAYLRHLFKTKEILAAMLTTYHNIYFINNLIRDIRKAIENDEFSSFKKVFLEKYCQT